MTIATWVLAIATLILAAEGGTALLQWRARWEARAEESRTASARKENELHRQRFAEVWNWQRIQPAGDDRVKSARWYGEWTGNDKPYRGGMDPTPLTPGMHSGSQDEAYENYLGFLRGRYDRPL